MIGILCLEDDGASKSELGPPQEGRDDNPGECADDSSCDND